MWRTGVQRASLPRDWHFFRLVGRPREPCREKKRPQRSRMSYRLFEDSQGTEWQVWDVVPRLEERRAAVESDRRVDIKVIPFADRRRSTRRFANSRRSL